MRPASPRASAAPVPTFFLYGEAPRSVSPRFLHLETLEERSRPTGWNIRPHAHAELHHLFLIGSGSGAMQADGTTTRFAAPCFLVVPARTVHAFLWQRETAGQVLTVADAYLRRLLPREQDVAGLFDQARCLEIADGAVMGERMDLLARELAWSAPGHAAAVDGNLLLILVEALRLQDQAVRRQQPSPGKPVQLVTRFRSWLEASYRSAPSVEDAARALGASPASLRRACAQVAGCTPACVMQERVFLEAQRVLLYTNMSVTEAAAYLGFQDSAYFSRFFAKRAGCPPRHFRTRAAYASPASGTGRD